MGKLWNKIFGYDKQREDEMREFSFQNDLQYFKKGDQSLISQLSEFDLFNTGGQQTIDHLISKKELLESKYLFDYSYTISTGKSNVTFSQTVKFFDSKNLSLPEFILKPEGFFTRLGEWFGSKDIDFDEDIDFSDMFHLKGEFEPVIRNYFDKEVRNLCKRNKNFYVTGMNYYMIVYLEGSVLKGSELSAFHKLSELIFEILKLQSISNTNNP